MRHFSHKLASGQIIRRDVLPRFRHMDRYSKLDDETSSAGLRGSLETKTHRIAIEIDEVVFVRFSNPFGMAWCPGCANEVVMVTPEQAAVIAQVSVRDINRRVEAGQVHFLETTEGALLVCMSSLS